MTSNSITNRISNVCMNLIMRYPFYGYLLLHMDIKETTKQKAYTDMKSIFLNYKFIEGLDDFELEFVILHEILHAALKHPINVENHDLAIYSLAADIMVNTIVLDSMRTCQIQVGGRYITKSIFGNEVYIMGTEKIYQTLMNDRNSKYVKEMLGEKAVDSHQNWESKSLSRNREYLNGLWTKNISEATAYEKEHKRNGASGIGAIFSNISCEESNHVSNTEWKKVLRDFLTISNDKRDYSFAPPDRRFDSADVFIPDYNIIEEKKVGNLWFCVDTSMSMSSSDIESLYVEIGQCIHDLGSLDGRLSFFDESTTKPIEFHTIKDLYSIIPKGRRGTDFDCIFDYMRENMMNHLPTAIIIMTDGYAPFPMEIMACGIPVLWAIIGGNSVVPPWGKTIYI